MLPRRMRAVLFVGLVLALAAPGSRRAAEPPVRTDLHGDPLPAGATARLGTVRWRERAIIQMAFVPGGRSLATTDTSVLSVWDVETGRLTRTIGTDDPPDGPGFRAFAFTPDGKRLLSADEGIGALGALVAKPRLFLWEFPSGKLLMQSELGDLLAPDSVAIRSDGRMAACATSFGDVCLWDLGKNKVRHVIEGDGRTRIHSLSFTKEGKHLVVLPDAGGVCRRIDVASGEQLKQIDLGECGRVALATGTGTVATYTYPDRLELWDTSTGAKRRLLLKEKVGFLDVFFSPDSQTLLAVDRRAEVVQFWDVAKGELQRRLRVPGLAWTHEQTEVLLSWDGERLAGCEEQRLVRIWDARTGRPLHLPGHTLPPIQLSFSADGKEVVSHARRINPPGDQLLRWDATTGKLLADDSPNAPEEDWSGGWSLAPGGQHLAVRIDRTVYRYERKTGKRVLLTDQVAHASDWTFTPDGRAVVTMGANQEVHLWDASSGKHLRRLVLEKKGTPISWLRFTPDGRTLVTGEVWKKVHLWDAATGKHRTTLTLPSQREADEKPDEEWEIALSPDGRSLFVSNDGNLWIWDLVAGREIGPFEEDEHERRFTTTEQVAVSPDGRILAWFDSGCKLRLYEVCTGKIVHRFQGAHSSIAFAPSGWRLATGCNSSVLIWDLPQLFRSQPLPAKDTSAESLWEVLKSADAVLAQRALWRLAALPDADAFLARHLQPIAAVPPERLRVILADLGSPEFASREKAEETLGSEGEAVRAALAAAAAETKDAEVLRRLARLQERLQPLVGERLREVRAVLVLEARGTAAARRLLQRLAAGAPGARLTLEAKGALGRLPG